MSSSKAVASLASSCSLCFRHEARSRFFVRSLSSRQSSHFPPRSSHIHTQTPTATTQSAQSLSSPLSQQRYFTADSAKQQVEPAVTLLKKSKGKFGLEAGYRENKLNRPTVGRTRERKPFAVNTSIEALNEAFIKLLGEGGDKGLPDDLKWQCVTHKSFDHGMQPFNEKLAFFGRRITYLHTSIALLNASPNVAGKSIQELDREFKAGTVYKHEQYKNLDGISYMSVDQMVKAANPFAIAKVTGLVKCLRWKPRDAQELDESGLEDVAKGAIFAIIGAIGLHRGAEAARRVVLDRILASVKQLR